MAAPRHNACNPAPRCLWNVLRVVVLDFIKSPPQFLLHFYFGGILFYPQLQAGKEWEGKNQRWFKLGLLLGTITYLLICALSTFIAFIWHQQGNQSISQLCCGFWLPYYYETRPQAVAEAGAGAGAGPLQPQQLPQQLTAVQQAHVHLNMENQTLANAQAAKVQAMLAQIGAQEALLGSLLELHAQNIP